MPEEKMSMEDMLAQMGVSKEDAEQLFNEGVAANVRVTLGNAAKRRGLSEERYGEIIREAQESKGSLDDILDSIYDEEAPAGRSGVDQEKEQRAKSKSMSKAQVEKAYGDGDISREAYEESGHSPKN